MKAALTAVGFDGEVFYFGVPDDLVYPIDMMTFLRKNLTLRSGVTLECRRMLDGANTYLAQNPELQEAYVSHVFPASEVQAAFSAAIQPRRGQFKIAVDMT